MANVLKAFVGNLPFEWKNNDLADLGRQYGSVVGASVVIDRGTGRSRGFGFLTFTEAAAVPLAIAGLHGREVKGRPLSCRAAVPRGVGPVEVDDMGRVMEKDAAVADPFLATSQKSKKVTKSEKAVPGWGSW